MWSLAFVLDLLLVGICVLCVVLYALRAERAERLLARLARRDASWDRSSLEAHAARTAVALYDALCRKDLGVLRSVLHPRYCAEWAARVADLEARGVAVVVRWVEEPTAVVVGAENFREDELDSWTASVRGDLAYWEVDPRGSVVPGSFKRGSLLGLWTFEREGGRWLLSSVRGDAEVCQALPGILGVRVFDEEQERERGGSGRG